MRREKTNSLFRIALPTVIVIGVFCAQAAAQTPSPSPEPKTKPRTIARPVIVENKSAVPQVVTILHTLNGLKVFRLLLRSQEQVEAIARLDESFSFAGEVHTNVIAGLALDDGHTIAAWLPEAEAEMPLPTIGFAPRAPLPPSGSSAPSAAAQTQPSMTSIAVPGIPAINLPGGLLEPADLRVITRDGKRIHGRYVGLDGLTGLSLITLASNSLPKADDSTSETITVGQRLRVIGPQPAPPSEMKTTTAMYVRIGETAATVVNVNRSPSGGVVRVKIKSMKLTPANIGGIAISDAGETLGIVDAVEGNEATIVPIELVRMAAKRVMARQASVPRPWLGIKGQPIGSVSLEKIMRVGWELDRARELCEKREGIFLTSVAPGSPAAIAKLKPGDVILRVNNGDVRNAEEFSWLLDEVAPEIPVLFTVARPGKEDSEALEIKLSESPNPMFGLKAYEKLIEKSFKPGSLISEGIETVALKRRVASRFGSTGGLLVVSVQPSTNAFKAGLRAGDVIESIDGQPVLAGAWAVTPKVPGVPSTCIIVRNREKIVLTFQYSTHRYSRKPKH